MFDFLALSDYASVGLSKLLLIKWCLTFPFQFHVSVNIMELYLPSSLVLLRARPLQINFNLQ